MKHCLEFKGNGQPWSTSFELLEKPNTNDGIDENMKFVFNGLWLQNMGQKQISSGLAKKIYITNIIKDHR